MKWNLKIWHALLLIWAAIFILRFERLFEIVELLYSYVLLIFTNIELASNQFTFSLGDHLIGTILFLIVPIIIIFRYKKCRLFNQPLFASAFLVIILFFCFLFAPLISDRNPDFYKDIAVTKLLPPVSAVMEIRLLDTGNSELIQVPEFIGLKNRVIKAPFNNLIIYCDSAFISGDEIVYYQRNSRKIVPVELAEESNDGYFKSKIFILGTDEYGRDIFTRLIYGTRISMFIGLGAVIISFILGLFLGFLAGFKSGWLDLILNRFTDLFLAFPVIFLIIFVLALFGNNMISVIIVLGFSGWMGLFKLVKTEISTIKKKDFFISSVLLGVSPLSLMTKEFLPLILTSVIVNIVFQFGNVVLAESALSYLGLGLGNEFSSWGSMIQSGQEYISQSWWMILLPGLLLMITLLTINDLGNKIKAHYNPRIKYD